MVHQEQSGVVEAALNRVRAHEFHPLDDEGSFTVDRALGEHGVADLDDPDGLVRLLAVREHPERLRRPPRRH